MFMLRMIWTLGVSEFVRLVTGAIAAGTFLVCLTAMALGVTSTDPSLTFVACFTYVAVAAAFCLVITFYDVSYIISDKLQWTFIWRRRAENTYEISPLRALLRPVLLSFVPRHEDEAVTLGKGLLFAGCVAAIALEVVCYQALPFPGTFGTLGILTTACAFALAARAITTGRLLVEKSLVWDHQIAGVPVVP